MKFTISALLVVAAVCADMTTLTASASPVSTSTESNPAPAQNIQKTTESDRKPPATAPSPVWDWKPSGSTAPGTAAQKQNVATFIYAGKNCDGALLELTVEPNKGTSCARACVNGNKQVCVSGDSNTYEALVKKHFKSAPIVLTRGYKMKAKCTGKPQYVRGELADGKCYRNQMTTINPNGSVTRQQWLKPNCEGAADTTTTDTAAENNGKCQGGLTKQILGK